MKKLTLLTLFLSFIISHNIKPAAAAEAAKAAAIPAAWGLSDAQFTAVVLAEVNKAIKRARLKKDPAKLKVDSEAAKDKKKRRKINRPDEQVSSQDQEFLKGYLENILSTFEHVKTTKGKDKHHKCNLLEYLDSDDKSKNSEPRVLALIAKYIDPSLDVDVAGYKELIRKIRKSYLDNQIIVI